eukprot:TRINITY_DN14748_c0_g4_i1.p1 TRINITY_DN14748_c0_g4~~TRINITY_DN14748_c0_g4_i1.p1  ORF type:complete len:686 (+),score=102.02 TRINITY_DN14748_c0_g4_i1:45-2060(+)
MDAVNDEATPEMEAAWVEHCKKDDVRQVESGWVEFPKATVGWNPWRLVAVKEVGEESHEKDLCDYYYHCKLVGKAVEGWVVSRFEEAPWYVKAEAMRKYFPAGADLGGLKDLCGTYSFEVGAVDSVLQDLGATTTTVKSQKRKPKPPTQEEKLKKQQASLIAKRNWMKLAAHTKLTLLQDTILPHPTAGKSYASHIQPHATLKNSRFIPFDYSQIDEAVAKHPPAASLPDTVAQLIAPYERITWRCSPTQQGHYILRTFYTFLVKNFKATEAAEISTVEEVYSAKQTNSEGFAMVLARMVELSKVRVPNLDLKVTVVKGRTSGLVTAVGHPCGIKTAHWNIAEFGGEKYFVDAWLSVVEDTEVYWMTPPELFYHLHCPDAKSHQLASKPGHSSAWEVAPALKTPFITHGLALSSHVKYVHVHCKAPPLKIIFHLAEASVEVEGKVYHGGMLENSEKPEKEEVREGCIWQTRSVATSTVGFSIILPDTGLFTFEMWVWRVGGQFKHAMSYQLASGVKIGDDPLYPTQRVPPTQAILALPPKGKNLAGTPLTFRIYPLHPSITAAMVVQTPRAAPSPPVPPTFLLYDPLHCCYTGCVPNPLRGTIDVYLRTDGKFKKAFTNFIIAATYNKKEDLGGDTPLIEPPTADELAAMRKVVNGGTAVANANKVGGYFG